MRMVWDMTITGTGAPEFNQQVNDPSYQLAIKSMLMAYGCKQIGCCTSDFQSDLDDFVEDRVFGSFFPNTLVPLPFCQGDVLPGGTDKCGQCKVSIQAQVKQGECFKFFAPEPPHTEEDVKPFVATMVNPTAQIPYHISIKSRCQKMQTALAGQISSLVSQFNQIICPCLGCCQGATCPIAVAYPTLKKAIGS